MCSILSGRKSSLSVEKCSAAKRTGSLRRFYYKVERKKGGQIAKVATARKLLEWIYHMLKDGKSYQEVEKVVTAMRRDEPVKNTGL